MNQITKRTSQVDYILLDGSASMGNGIGSKWDDSKNAIDAYLGGLKAEHINSDVYIHLFADHDETDMLAFDGALSTFETIRGLRTPFGGTWLYEAIRIAATRIRSWDGPPGRLTILTDGEDASYDRGTTLVQAKSYLDWLRAKGWQVVFIGCDFSNAEQAKMLGADKGASVAVAQARLVDAAAAHAKKAARHARTGEDMRYSEEEQEKFGGYLAPPRK